MSIPAFFKTSWPIFIFAVFTSLFLSTYINIREVVLNPDAICYLQSAEVLDKQGLEAAIHLCDQSRWPFYSMLIYSVVKIFHFSYTNAAYVLDAVFSAMTVIFFLIIIRFMGANRRILFFAALLILLAHEFNSIRQYIVRDHGFWAFYLLSIFWMLNFFKEFKTRYAVLWGLSSFIALLFRVEGTILLLFIPMIIWFDNRIQFWKKIVYYFKLNLITITLISLILLWFWLHPNKTMQHLGRLQEVQFQLTHGFSVINDGFNTRTHNLAQYIILGDGARDASIIFTLVVITSYFLNVISNLTLIFSILLVYAWWKKLFRVAKNYRLVIWGYVWVNLFITLTFFFENMYLSKRYLIATTLTLMFWLPYVLEDFYQRFLLYFSIRKIYWLFPIILSWIFISSIGGIIDFGYSKEYLRNAGDWLAKNIPFDNKLYSNDYQLMYYSKHFGAKIFDTAKYYMEPRNFLNGGLNQYDYIALRYNKEELNKHPTLLFEIHDMPLKSFSNERGDVVNIYKIKH